MAATIKELLQERLATLVKIHIAVAEGYKQLASGITLDDLHQAEVAVQLARLDLCESKQDRIKVYDDMVNEAEQWQNVIEKIVIASQAPAFELLKAKAYLLQNNLDLQIEVETRNLEEVKQVITAGGIHRIMLDNFELPKLKEAVNMINKQYETEASGGITLSNLLSYAETGVDYISMGALTHSVKALNGSL